MMWCSISATLMIIRIRILPFANSYSPDGKVYRDTLGVCWPIMTADGLERAQAHTTICPSLSSRAYSSPSEGTYRFELIQGMRNDSLHGISDIGIRIMHTPNPIKR